MRMWRRSLLLLGLALLAGCAASPPAPPAPRADPALDDGYALLLELLRDERRLDGILLIRRPPADTVALVREIAARTGAEDEALAALLPEAPAVVLPDDPLPVIERRARSAIASRTSRELTFGRTHVEIRLLLTQAEALRYGRHLAVALAEDDPHPGRQARLETLAGDLAQLRARTLDRLAALSRDGGDS